MKLLLYCTKAKPYLYGMYSGFESRYGYHLTNDKNVFNQHNVLNGKIVAECDFEVEEITLKFDDYEVWIESDTDENVILKQSCLDDVELYNYLGGANGDRGYAIHIKNLHIFDKPYELGKALIYNFNTQYIVEKAPQNMMKVYNRAGECHILISIKPEWLCKILNGEKTIEVRKKVLREMLE